jgi:putative transposase
VFLCDADYKYYLENMIEAKCEFLIKVYAYCLMTNHVHMVIEPAQDVSSVGLFMKRLAGRQTRYVNKLEGRTGSLWEGRYKISPIERESYLLACCRYVELNPVKAGMVVGPEDYRWSSYRARVEGALGWLDDHACFSELASDPVGRVAAYKTFVNRTDDTGADALIRQAVQRNQLTGNCRFIDEIENRLGIRVEFRGGGRPRSR